VLLIQTGFHLFVLEEEQEVEGLAVVRSSLFLLQRAGMIVSASVQLEQASQNHPLFETVLPHH